MSSKSAKNTTAADDKKVVVSFSSDSDDDDDKSSSSSSSSSSESESSSESDAETTKLNSDKAPPPPSPPSTSKAAEEDSVETVSFTLSLSAVNRDDDSPAEEELKKRQKVEPPPTTTRQQTKDASAAAAAAETPRDEVKQPTRRESPENTPNAVIKPADSEASDAKKKTLAKKATKSTTKSLKAEAINGGEKLDTAAGKTDKAVPVAEAKVVVQTEPSNTSAAASKTTTDAATTSPSASAAETAEDDDDVETVSFTLSLSAVSNDDSAAEKAPEKEQKVETKAEVGKETKSRPAAAEEQRGEVKQQSPGNAPDSVIKPPENEAGDGKKKIAAKKATKTTTKPSKAEAINGGEKLETAADKTDKAVPVAEAKIVVQTEPPNTSAAAPEAAANAVNGETKPATKIVKKKTKKASDDTATAPSTEEKSDTKEIVTQNQPVTNAESPKASTANVTDETSSAVNGEATSTAKLTKKKIAKKATTESIPAVAEEKEASRAEDKAVVKEKTEREAVSTEKPEAAKALPADSAAEANAASEVTKPAATETTVVKKKPKKVASNASTKISASQEDVTVPVGNLGTSENSSAKQQDDVAMTKSSTETEAVTSAVERTKTAQETSSGSADKEAAVSESTASDKVIAKKKKPKKAAASAPAESAETTLIGEIEHSSAGSNVNVDVTQAAAADAGLSGKAAQDVTFVVDNAVDEAAASITIAPLSTQKSNAKDDKKSPSPVVPLIATADETEVSNIVTLIQLDDTGNEASMQNASAPTKISSSTDDISAETKPEMFKSTVTSTDTSVDTLTTDVKAGDSKNEESDYSYRRKSMDDFIKRILAEAREEQQKRMASTTNSGSDTANLLDLDSTATDSDKLGLSLNPTSSDDVSMLDRRLASTDRKRVQKEEFGEWTSRNAPQDADLDQDLAEIGRYFAKRNLTSTSKYDVDVAEKNGDWSASRVRDIRQFDVDSAAGQESRRPQQNGLPEDSFVPHAREETAELVRNSSRPVRAIIDQQSDVVQLLKTTGRGVDDLESEIRNLRATFLDRQARIETLQGAIDAEVRAYQADQHAANERIQQQNLPGGHFVRDEFMRANNIVPSSRSSAIDELLGAAPPPRRRSGSVSSTSGMVSGAAAPSGMSSSDLDYKSSALNSWVLGARSSVTDQVRRNDIDDDASSTASGYSTARSRRGGSVVRDRTYMSEDAMGPRMDNSRSYLLPAYDNSSPSAYSFGSPITYPPLRSSSSTRSYYQTDYGTTSSVPSAALSNYGGADNTRGYYGGGDTRSYGYSPFGGTATNDPSRFRRAQSVSDFTSERSASSDRSHGSALSSSAGQFQSRFLDKVRARKAYGDDQYRSRFLASDSGSSRYSSRRNYSSND